MVCDTTILLLADGTSGEIRPGGIAPTTSRHETRTWPNAKQFKGGMNLYIKNTPFKLFGVSPGLSRETVTCVSSWNPHGRCFVFQKGEKRLEYNLYQYADFVAALGRSSSISTLYWLLSNATWEVYGETNNVNADETKGKMTRVT